MTIPVFENIKFVDDNGFLTAEWQDILQDLFRTLQLNFSDEGLVMPKQTAANIALLADSENGAMVYDTDNDEAMVNIAGTFKKISYT